MDNNKEMKKGTLVVVEWQDTTINISWHGENNLEDCQPNVCFTVGWQVNSSRTILRIASTRNINGEWVGITAIPKGCVRNIRKLDEGLVRG